MKSTKRNNEKCVNSGGVKTKLFDENFRHSQGNVASSRSDMWLLRSATNVRIDKLSPDEQWIWYKTISYWTSRDSSSELSHMRNNDTRQKRYDKMTWQCEEKMWTKQKHFECGSRPVTRITQNGIWVVNSCWDTFEIVFSCCTCTISLFTTVNVFLHSSHSTQSLGKLPRQKLLTSN